MTLLARLVIGAVHTYQRCISPFRAPSCRFSPTCSQFMIESIQKHGVLRGGARGVWRILRCNPFGGAGFDPP